MLACIVCFVFTAGRIWIRRKLGFAIRLLLLYTGSRFGLPVRANSYDANGKIQVSPQPVPYNYVPHSPWAPPTVRKEPEDEEAQRALNERALEKNK